MPREVSEFPESRTLPATHGPGAKESLILSTPETLRERSQFLPKTGAGLSAERKQNKASTEN